MPRSARTTAAPTSAASCSPAWLFVIGLLVAARYLQPTEAVVFGETLWQAQLWLAASAVWCWFLYRGGRGTLRGSLLDLLLWGLVLGHALATLPVLLDGGDRRAAVNVVWEWAGLAAAFFLIRQVLRDEAIGRVLPAFAAVMVSIAALGVWQYHVALPQMAAGYDSLRNEETTLVERIASGEATATQRARLGEVRGELAEYGVPAEVGARKRWEDRLQYSTEPFGTFGLANTLGGLLAAALPFAILSLRPRRRSAAILIGLGSAAGLLLYCLVLTKSRTAWVGLLAGSVAVAALHAVRGRTAWKLVGTITSVLVAAVLLLGIAYAAGGIDRQVFSEAPKSLQYRLDYWSGALEVLSERPLLGTGPGNFRSHYLEHRPPGASEEIAAPHNVLLDVWTAGGLLSLALLLAFIALVMIRFLQADQCENIPHSRSAADENGGEESHAGTSGGEAWTPLETGVVAAFPAVVAVYFLSGNGIDWRLPAIAPVAAALLFCLNRSNAAASLVVSAGAGFLALIVHLLGADGIELPAVIQTLLLFGAVIDRSQENVLRPTRLPPRVAGVLPAAGFGVLSVACLLTGLVPVLNAAALTARGEQLIREGQPTAERVIQQAAEADPLAMRPIELLAELATSRALSSRSLADLQAAERRWQDVLEADPRNLRARRQLAGLYRNRNDASLAGEAAELLRDAVALSPTDARLRRQSAEACAAAGDSAAAAEQARQALRLDDLNRAAGHVDVILNQTARESLERLASVGQSPPEP